MSAPCRLPMQEIVAEASRALAHLDAARLEELAAACEALRRDVNALPAPEWGALRQEVRQALRPLIHYAHLLDATSANLNVLHNVMERRSERLEYGCRQMRG